MSAEEHSLRWDVDQDGIERPDDCDDKDKNVQDLTWYSDGDGDGFGDAQTGISACERPTGAVDNGDDCDDDAASTNPGASEQCNEVDDNCDGVVDEGDDLVPTWFEDGDGDGFGVTGAELSACTQPSGYSDKSGDCDDGDDTIHPDAEDVCNGVNDDCDGGADDDDAHWVDWYDDVDGDLFGDEDLAPTVTACFGNPGDVDNADDCDDVDPFINPDADEVCDGDDNDCDGSTDSGASDATEWWPDADGDGFGLVGNSVFLCTCEPGFGCYRADNPADCDDMDPDVNPIADEICANGVDDNCNFSVDEALCVTCDTADTGC